ncbi:exported protein of unknown function [Xenorhabdus poinarii G6]|uniref:Lipoprotein n=1 Tax=Xenorhabdus poinarii G6 TaxID=1354304 RepID=A0A068QZZ8_9GAMM|nr:hypothetical protein [Xenorhabdus poinarii]CDG20617.1 exported protein of unknown function [Xenorhabdus poinarii G6]
MKKIGLIGSVIFASFVLMGCASKGFLEFLGGSLEGEERQYSLTKEERIKLAKERVLNGLKDSESAIFKDVHFSKDDRFVCMMVNAKNSFGGYTGFEGIIVSPTSQFLLGRNDKLYDFNAIWNQTCL